MALTHKRVNNLRTPREVLSAMTEFFQEALSEGNIASLDVGERYINVKLHNFTGATEYAYVLINAVGDLDDGFYSGIRVWPYSTHDFTEDGSVEIPDSYEIAQTRARTGTRFTPGSEVASAQFSSASPFISWRPDTLLYSVDREHFYYSGRYNYSLDESGVVELLSPEGLPPENMLMTRIAPDVETSPLTLRMTAHVRFGLAIVAELTGSRNWTSFFEISRPTYEDGSFNLYGNRPLFCIYRVGTDEPQQRVVCSKIKSDFASYSCSKHNNLRRFHINPYKSVRKTENGEVVITKVTNISDGMNIYVGSLPLLRFTSSSLMPRENIHNGSFLNYIACSSTEDYSGMRVLIAHEQTS